ncbi:hypothetical protein JCM11491_000178 [Sporobolomyces phaffii]
MFAFVVPGQSLSPIARVSQQAVQDPAAPERFLAQIEHAHELNHVTVFLTGQQPFPPGYAATVHLALPNSGKGFQLIGGLSNEKPSAIFRLRGTNALPASAFTALDSPALASTSAATLGILCEPVDAVAAHLAALPAASTSTSTSTALVPASAGAGADPVKLAQLIGKNLFNAVAGFVKPGLPGGPVGAGDGWIEFGQVENWYRNFERKLRLGGVGFLLQSD